MDWDGDGRLDIIVGDREGNVHFFRRLSYGDIYLEEQDLVKVQGKPIDVGYNSAPCVTDWNADGLPDMVVGNLSPLPSGVYLFINSGSPFSPEYLSTDTVFFQGGVIELTAAYPDVHDMNLDGLPDLLVGSSNGTVACYLNSGTPEQPLFETMEHLRADGDEIYICSYVRPSVCNWNDDGCPDMLLADDSGEILLFLGVPPSGIPQESQTAVRLLGNPVDARVDLEVALVEDAFVSVTIYSFDGRVVLSASRGVLPPGTTEIHLDTGDLREGAYLLRITTGTSETTRRIAVIR